MSHHPIFSVSEAQAYGTANFILFFLVKKKSASYLSCRYSILCPPPLNIFILALKFPTRAFTILNTEKNKFRILLRTLNLPIHFIRFHELSPQYNFSSPDVASISTGLIA